MPRWTSSALAALGLALVVAPRLAAQDLTADPTSLLWGRQFTEWFYAGEVDSIFNRYDDDNRKEDGDSKKLAEILGEVREKGGMEVEVYSEEVKPDTLGGYRYVRRVQFSNVPAMVVRVVWVIDRDRKIAGFGIRPEEQGN